MEKAARKTSADPVQEKLRKDKDVWNKQVSQFIENVKQVKKTMNGYPSKLNPQKGNIKNPLPTSVPSTLEALTQAFDNIAQSGESIVEEQLAYSKNRRKNQPKAPVAPPAPAQTPAEPAAPETPDLTKQLTAWEEKYGLVAEASNPVSRFFTKLLNPSFGFGEAARIRRVRMQLLKACADTYKKLGRLQVDVVKSSKSSIETANNLMHESWRHWETVRTGFTTYKGMMPVQVPDAGGPIEEPKDVKEEKEQEEKSVEKQMERVDRAQETGAPEPGDPDYEKPPSEEPDEKSPDWIQTKENIYQDLHADQEITLAKWNVSDTKFALKNMLWFIDNHIDPSEFNEMVAAIKSFSIRDKDHILAGVINDNHRKLVDDLSSRLQMRAKSFRDMIAIIKKRERINEQAAKQQAQLEALQRREQIKQQDIQEKQEAARLKAQQKSEEEDRKQQAKVQQQLEQAKQKALLHNPPPSSAASDQLEVTAQAFLKKWIGKTRHQMSLFDQTSSQRLQIFEVAGEMRKTLNDIMDHLEKDLKVDEVGPMINKANHQMSQIRSLTRNLHNTHRPLPKGKK